MESGFQMVFLPILPDTQLTDYCQWKCIAQFSICSVRLIHLFTFAFLPSFSSLFENVRLDFTKRVCLRHE